MNEKVCNKCNLQLPIEKFTKKSLNLKKKNNLDYKHISLKNWKDLPDDIINWKIQKF